MEQKTVETTTVQTPAAPVTTSSSSSTTTGTPPPSYNKKKTIFYLHEIIWFILGVIEVGMTFRLLLKLFAANAGSGFANFVYNITMPFILPFQGIFPTSAASGSVMEWSTLFAMVVYFVIALGIVKLVKLAKPVTPGEVHEKIDNG